MSRTTFYGRYKPVSSKKVLARTVASPDGTAVVVNDRAMLADIHSGVAVLNVSWSDVMNMPMGESKGILVSGRTKIVHYLVQRLPVTTGELFRVHITTFIRGDINLEDSLKSFTNED